jgi:hypothetical protein
MVVQKRVREADGKIHNFPHYPEGPVMPVAPLFIISIAKVSMDGQ